MEQINPISEEVSIFLENQIKLSDDLSLRIKNETEFFRRLETCHKQQGADFAVLTGIYIARLEMTITELTSKLIKVNNVINPITERQNQLNQNVNF